MTASDFLWLRPAAPTRGPKPTLTLDQIADAAITIADSDGLAALSMHRVAGDLGFTKMSLYRYLPGKTELVALIVDRAVGAPPTVDTEDWRSGLTVWSHGLLAAFLAHPWAIEATVGPRPIGPHELGWMETAAVVLAGTGLSGSERLDTMALLTGHIRMIAQQAAASPRPEAQMQTTIGELLRDRADQFPALAAAVLSSVTDEGQDDAFTFGLERILDGLQALIVSRAKPQHSRAKPRR